jgi:hypothetical protein
MPNSIESLTDKEKNDIVRGWAERLNTARLRAHEIGMKIWYDPLVGTMDYLLVNNTGRTIITTKEISQIEEFIAHCSELKAFL